MKIGKLYITVWTEWRDIIFRPKSMNWINFTPIHLTFEYAPYKETYEIIVGLLGFHACVEWFYGTPYNNKED